MPAPKKRTAPYAAVKTIHGKRAQAGEPLAFIRAHVRHAGDDCLIWPYGRYGNGYCAIIHEGVQTFAHRVMCKLAHGEPAYEDLEASHTCDKGHDGCVNPKHLVWETHVENHQRRRGRPHTRNSEARVHNRSTLTPEQVLHVWRSDRSALDLAKECGVTRATIYAIRSGKKWAWLTKAA